MNDVDKRRLLELCRKQKRYEEQQAFLSYDSELNNPNYNALLEAVLKQEYNSSGELVSGKRGMVLEGSSRSGKTWSGVDLIVYLSTVKHKDDGCTINLYRETYNEFKTTLYDDFKRRLDHFNLPNKFKETDEVKSFKIGNSKIYFLGDGKHGGGCDYAFFNEAMMQKKSVFDQVEMRCRVFWWMDYNPSFTEHWVFNSVLPRNDVGFLRTTFLDNPYITSQERSKILNSEPWEPGTYDVVDSRIMYDMVEVSESNQPPPHIINIEQGTADEFYWKVYGLGLRGAMKGLVFKDVTYIDEFPDVAHTYGLDFGFTVDPTALVKYAEEGDNIYLELLSYEPMEDPETIDNYLTAIRVDKYTPITADSSDRFVHHTKGSFQMVTSLEDMGWEITKVSKTNSVMFWLNSMKKKKIHIVRNHLFKYARKEQENYRLKEINGIAINQPEDKFNHFWDSARYAHMSYSNDLSSSWN